jgi:hypothetical protein
MDKLGLEVVLGIHMKKPILMSLPTLIIKRRAMAEPCCWTMILLRLILIVATMMES